jgi:hypothetical protein
MTKETIDRLLEKAKEQDVERVKIDSIDGEDITIEVKSTLSMEEIYQVCSALQTSPFVKSDDDELMYLPSAEISTFKVALLKAFVPSVELPEDVIEAYQVCSKLDLFQKVHCALKNNSMYCDLLTIADRYSEYHRLANSGASTIISFVKKALSEVDVQGLITNFMTSFAEMQDGNAVDLISDIVGDEDSSSEDAIDNDDE